MLSFLTKKKGQSTAEYAILIALVVAAAMAMQTYVKRSLQGGIKFVVDKSAKSGGTKQYEPYYLESTSETTVGRYEDTEKTELGGKVTRTFGDKTTIRTSQQKIKDTTEAD